MISEYELRMIEQSDSVGMATAIMLIGEIRQLQDQLEEEKKLVIQHAETAEITAMPGQLRAMFVGQAITGLLSYISRDDWRDGKFSHAGTYAQAAVMIADAVLVELGRKA